MPTTSSAHWSHAAGRRTGSLPAVTAALETLVIAVDGTSGSGKSSTCRAVADRLRLRYLDTGAMFRAVTWWLLDQGVDVHDADAVAAVAERPVLVSGTDPRNPTIAVDGTDVSVAIRTEAVTRAVSPVSTVPAVRARLLRLQRESIGTGGIVVEGRDIASVVWPQAQVKVYLTADPAARAAVGTNPLGPRTRAPSARAGRPQADTVLAAVRGFWT